MTHRFHNLRHPRPFLFFISLILMGMTANAQTANGTTTDGKPMRILFLGDSLTAGYGLSPEEAYPALIAERFEAEGYFVEVINSGLSGETTAGGLRRVRWVLRQPADIMVLALGANDALRGLEISNVEENLQGIIDAARSASPGLRIILAGLFAPPNMGAEYAEAFADVYLRLAERNRLPLIPFLLEGVAGEAALNQGDGIHPTAEGQEKMARLVYPWVETAVREVRQSDPGAARG